MSDGNDIARIYGNGGNDSLTVNATAPNFTLYDGDTGVALFTVGSGGSTITAYGIIHITVFGPDGNVLYQR